MGAHRQARHGRPRKRPQRLLTLALSAGLLVLLAAVAVLAGGAFGRGGGGAAAAVEHGTSRQQTVLLAVGTRGHTASGAVLIGAAQTSSGPTASLLALPMHLVTAVPDEGTEPLGRALKGTDYDRAEAAVSDLLGVRIDGGMTVTPAGLAAVVDRIGGVTVDVDHDVPSAHGTLLAQVGHDHLDGVAAAAYATLLAGSEPEARRMARLSQVLGAVLDALPASAGQVVSLLGSLGDAVGTDGSLNLPAQTLGVAGAASRSGALQAASLPVEGLGDGEYEYRADAAVVARTASAQFADARIVLPAGTPSVDVVNAAARSGVALAVRARLVSARLAYAGSQIARTGLRTSRVLIPDGSAASVAMGQRVAQALGLAPSAVAVDGLGQRLADVMVIIGTDWRG